MDSQQLLPRERLFPTKKSQPKKSSKAKKQSKYHLEPVDSSYPKKGTVTSFSQYSRYAKCPRSWKLRYIDKQKDDEKGSIHLLFGEVMHEIIQDYLTKCFKESVTEADKIDFTQTLKERLVVKYTEQKEKYKTHFVTAEELEEFYWDGLGILNELRKRRREFFSTKHLVLLGIELPIKVEVHPNVWMISFLDIIFYDPTEDVYYVMDFKTATRGWRDAEKKDPYKTGQLVLYKKYLADVYGLPIDKIEVEFIILKRKIIEDCEFPQKRLQRFIPSSGTKTVKKVMTSFQTFLDEVYDKDGKFKTNRSFPAIAGAKDANCKFCPYVDRNDLCPSSERQR